MGKSKSTIPDRWLEYKALGKRVPETRFICCKCPLKEELCRKLPSRSKWFTPECLFRALAEENLSLGLVIDLTNTDRYYNPNAFTYTGVEYAKIFTPGHDVPGEDAIKMFRDIILTYDKNSDNKDKLIAVHCTHGVNRTGYQVCHYLIETCGWSFEKAVQAFNMARGHQLERQNYLQALNELDNKVNNKPHIFLHDDAESDDEDDASSVKRKRVRQNSASSSTSSADSLFKPEPTAVAPEPFVPPAQVKNVPTPFVTPFAPPATVAAATAPPMFNPAVMQHMLMNVAQMQQAMMNSNRFMPPPLQLQPTNFMQPGGPLVFRPPGFMAPGQTVVNPSQSKDISSSSSSSDNSTTSSGTSSESSSESEEEEEQQEESSSSSSDKEEKKETEEKEDEQNVEPSGSSETPAQRTADWELGGKVDVKKKTAAQKRRERQQKVAEMHRTLQSGKFWKIREMQKEKYGF